MAPAMSLVPKIASPPVTRARSFISTLRLFRVKKPPRGSPGFCPPNSTGEVTAALEACEASPKMLVGYTAILALANWFSVSRISSFDVWLKWPCRLIWLVSN